MGETEICEDKLKEIIGTGLNWLRIGYNGMFL
jgi:hypothetical protein